jgi:Rod binding domain-containing protein
MNPIEQVLSTQSQLIAAKPELTSLKKSCEGMEATFLKQMVTEMRKSAGSVRFGKEFGGEMYRDMYDGSISDILAQKGTLGVAKQMYSAVAPQVLSQAAAKLSTSRISTNKISMEGNNN